MRYRLRWMQLLCVLCGVAMSHVYASDYLWKDGDTIDGGTVVAAAREGQPKISNVLGIGGDIIIDGDITISNTLQMTDYDDAFTVTIWQDSFLHPSAGSTNSYGHLIFYTAECCQTLVFVDNDLIFTGSNIGDRHADNRELTLTFSGPGQVVFHLASGRQVGFEGFFGDYSKTGWSKYYDDYSSTGSGVMVYITMDQTHARAIEQGQNKVVFERYYAYDETLADPTWSNTHETTKVTIGKNSFITYISNVADGLLACSDSAVGYGSLAFDPMCYGRGRMLLRLKGSHYVVSGDTQGLTNAYNDGALVVGGHYVEDYSTPDGIRLGVQLNQPAGVEAIFRIIDERGWSNATYYRDGSDLYMDETTGEPEINPSAGPGNPNAGRPSRRGLLVVNECKSIPQFAADPYVNNGWANEYIFQTRGVGSTSIRPGFVLANNGCMEVFHNTFLDYVATSTQRINPYERDWEGNGLLLSRIKKHNPSALFVDGLQIFNLSNFDPSNPYLLENALHYPYVADVATNGGRHANVLLRGDARLYLRSGCQSDGSVADLDWFTTPSLMGGYWVGLDRLYSFTINSSSTEGSYDGSFMAGVATNGGLLYETTGEGNNVLDVEGKLAIRSTNDVNTTNDAGFLIHKLNIEATPGVGCYLARHVLTSVGARGVLNVSPIKLDNMGREIKDDLFTVVSRPLTVNSVYPCYNSSSLFLNTEIALHNVNWHHNDLLKIATPEQDKAEPVLVGGEKAAFDYAYWSALSSSSSGTADTLFVENPVENINTKVPLVSLYTSTLYLHESFVGTGVRFVVTDKFWYDPNDALGHPKLVPNISALVCYNHGDPLDMLKRGYGRTFLLGSQQNMMANGIVASGFTADYLQNAYLNIYRGWNTDGNAGIWGDGYYPIMLSLETDAQPRYTIQYETRATHPSGSDAFSKLLEWSIDQYKRVATQVVYLGNASYSSLGWTTTMGDQVISLDDMRQRRYAPDGSYSYSSGINEGHRPRPWDISWSLGTRTGVDGSSLTTIDFLYSLSSNANDHAELYVNGDDYYFGGRDASGNLATEPVVASNESCIFYTNHGGRTHINQDTISVDQGHYYDCYVDTIFAYRPWPRIKEDPADSTSNWIDGLSGLVELPYDQVKWGRSTQPYALDFTTMLLPNDGQTKESNVRLSVYDEQRFGVSPVNRKKASGEEVSIAWNFRTDKSVRIGSMESTPTYTPFKLFGSDYIMKGGRDKKADPFRSFVARSTEIGENVGPVDMTDALLTVSTGDDITQLRVSGATRADPFHIYVSGGTDGYGIVREFTSLSSNYFNPGEGCHAAIMVDGGGHFGLGSRHWNEHSTKAWSILGYDYVTLYPNGNGFVWVNSDLIVHDRLAIIPTKNFGSYGNERQVLTHNTNDQRLTFYSEVPREIRIPEGRELDLSAFGYPTAGGGTASSTFPQQIEIGGKIRLVFEPGSKLRFSSEPTHQPVLYLNDEAEIIIEGSEDIDREEYTSLADSDPYRVKFLGVGQIWLNKNARMRINASARLGIETDDETITTSVTISIQRQATMFIGDENVSGGAVQVGNITDKSGHQIDFVLALRSEESSVLIHREGFLGFAVGAVNKQNAPNGNWRLQGLYNVNSININMDNSGVGGRFIHNQIFNGDNRQASLIGIGPATTYIFSFGDPQTAVIRGGGNLIYIPTTGTMYPNLGATLPPYDTGTYGDIVGDVAGDGTTLGDINILMTTGYLIQKGATFTGGASAFFTYLSMPDISTFYLTGATYVALGELGGRARIGWVDGTEILRQEDPRLDGVNNLESSLKRGALTCNYQPTALTAIDRMGDLSGSTL